MDKYYTEVEFAISLKDFLKNNYSLDLKTTDKFPLGFRLAFASYKGRNYNKRFHHEVDEAIKLIRRSGEFVQPLPVFSMESSQ